MTSGPANVVFVPKRQKNASAVPVGALVSLGEGGCGVQVVEGGAVRSVPTGTGLFASGQVQVGGEGMAEGVGVGVRW